MSPGTMPGFLGYPEQPDFMEMVDAFHPNLAKITAQHWIDGDDEERATIDRNLERARERERKNQDREHHRMVFGVYPF